MKLLLVILKSILITLLVAVVILALIGAYRYFGFKQIDNEEKIKSKQNYLQQLSQIELPEASPNILFILYDDMGYGDIGFGAGESNPISTPNIDALATKGVMLSDFHSPAPVCSPARAGFMTGRIPPRAGLPDVLFPTGGGVFIATRLLFGSDTNIRLPAEEITMAEVLRAAGYRTGMVGKWHMGDRSPSLPNDMGFDSFYGALYSNDQKPFALYRNKDIEVSAPADQRRLTEQYTRAAIDFIQASDDSFFLYFAHNYPHIPLHIPDSHKGRSAGGLYGDILEEIDDGIGEIVGALRDTGKLDNTLIIITSDNGPWYLGDQGNLRGRKGNTFEGGMRVPFIAHWPLKLQAGRVEHSMAMGTDLLPTVLDILGLPAPADRALDGHSILPLLAAGGKTPHDFLYYYDGETLFAVREEKFKYRASAGVMYATDQMRFGISVPQKEWLFDLETDPREAYNVAEKYPEAFARLKSAYEARQQEMADNPRGWQ